MLAAIASAAIVTAVGAAAVDPPSLLADIRSGRLGSGPDLSAFNGIALFTANDGTHGRELWRSDGTKEGTYLVKDINPGGASAFSDSFYASAREHRGVSLFRANDGVHGTELWRSDGTAAGTWMVSDINPGPDGSDHGSASNATSGADAAGAGDYWIFVADDGIHGAEPWRTDLTDGTTTLLKDVRAGATSSYPGQFTTVGNNVFFAADDGRVGEEVWKTDGTAEGTVLLKDINQDPASGNAVPHDFVDLNGTLLFSAITSNAVMSGGLWRSDGTTEGTTLVENGFGGNGPAWLTVVGDRVFLSGIHAPYGWELWSSDGTTPGTRVVKDIRPGGLDSRPEYLVGADTKVFFDAYDDGYGYELWVSDGTEAGTHLVRDMTPGPESSVTFYGTGILGRLFFLAEDPVHGREPWVSDGTAEGTELIADIWPGVTSSNAGLFTLAGSSILFSAEDATYGAELWRLAAAPTAVVVRSFRAQTSAAGVLLRWWVEHPTSINGFNLYRHSTERLVKLNRTLIPAAVSRGHAYRWLDRSARSGKATYRLQAVSLSGKRSWVGSAVVPG